MIAPLTLGYDSREAQMNEGGELWRESRAGIVESWNHGNEESLELGEHFEAGEETRGGYEVEKEKN